MNYFAFASRSFNNYYLNMRGTLDISFPNMVKAQCLIQTPTQYLHKQDILERK